MRNEGIDLMIQITGDFIQLEDGDGELVGGCLVILRHQRIDSRDQDLCTRDLWSDLFSWTLLSRKLCRRTLRLSNVWVILQVSLRVK